MTLLASCGARVDAWPDGLRRSEGRLAITSSAAVEREEGPWTWWYPNGELREQGTIENGRRVGTWRQWYPNGQRRSEGARVWDEATRSSLRDGPWTLWFENGERKARGIYVRGKREGQWDYTLDDGSLDGDRTGEYHDDRRIDR